MLVDQPNPFTSNPYQPFANTLPLLSISYLHEREHKREWRRESAQAGTAIAISQLADQERKLLFDLRSAFVQVLQQNAVLALAHEKLEYYDRLLDVSRNRLKAGDIAQGGSRPLGADLVARYLPHYRDTKEAIENIRLLAPSGERVSLPQLCTIRIVDGASQLYREGNSRYVAIKYGVRGRDLGSTVEQAIREVNWHVKLPPRYTIRWEGEYESQKRSELRLLIIVPGTVFLIFLIIYGAFGSAKWACLNLVNVAVARVGGLLALYITGTHFSVSSGVGFLALFGASVQTGLIMVEYINQLRARGYSIETAAIEGAVRRLRPT